MVIFNTFFFKQKTAYEMRISDWSSDVCSSDLDIIAHVESRVHTSPLFRRRLHRLPLDVDHPYWVEDEHFDVEAHMTHARLPEPGDWRQFCIAVARWFSKPMDMNRPLWDIYIIEGLDRIAGIPPGSFAMLHRVHHAAVDGASGAHAFIAMSDIDAAGRASCRERVCPYV